jgi:hypothetical protein
MSKFTAVQNNGVSLAGDNLNALTNVITTVAGAGGVIAPPGDPGSQPVTKNVVRTSLNYVPDATAAYATVRVKDQSGRLVTTRVIDLPAGEGGDGGSVDITGEPVVNAGTIDLADSQINIVSNGGNGLLGPASEATTALVRCCIHYVPDVDATFLNILIKPHGSGTTLNTIRYDLPKDFLSGIESGVTNPIYIPIFFEWADTSYTTGKAYDIQVNEQNGSDTGGTLTYTEAVVSVPQGVTSGGGSNPANVPFDASWLDTLAQGTEEYTVSIQETDATDGGSVTLAFAETD